MGITIHFSGRVADASRIPVAIEVARAAAERRGWATNPFANPQATLSRSSLEREWQYTGPTQGVVITPHELCEPFCVEFDGDGVAQDYVKTQFAGVDTHIGVVEVLRELQPLFESLDVVDEGEYWDSGDRAHLTRLVESCDAQLAQHIRSNPRARGPLRLDNGRMIDVVEINDGQAEATKPWWRFW